MIIFIFIFIYSNISNKILYQSKLVDKKVLNFTREYETVVPNLINVDFIHQKQKYFCE